MLIALVLSVMACNTVPINPNDSTPPNVEIKVRGSDGQYHPMTSTTINATTGQFDIMCVVSDPQGVSSASLSFSGGSDSCTVNGATHSGSFSINGKPQDLFQNLSGDSSGKVLTTLPLLSTVKGPFTCTAKKLNDGIPYGAIIRAQCTGRNWASNPQNSTTTKELEIKIQ